MKKGKFIAIEGPDGSGKETQTKILIENLQKKGFKIKTIDFPRYYDNFFGKFVGECLRGDHGDFVNLDPKIASVLYAADRWESSKKIKEWLIDGYIVIADRYASANQIHQGGKISDEQEREKFLNWLSKMEYEIFQIPQPDQIIYLDVPAEISQQLVQNKNNQKSKKYLNGKRDQSENNENYLLNSIASAQKLIQDNNNWIKINCTENGELLSREKIAENIWNEVEEIIN